MSQELKFGKYEFHPYEFNWIENVSVEDGLTEVSVSDNVNRLMSIGFSLVGRWKLIGEKLDFAVFGDSNGDKVLYAFVVDAELMYIGKTIKGLRRRMLNYRHAHSSQTTNTRNQKRILESLSMNEAVEIYMLPDTGLLKYGGFHINLAAGLEDSLIDELSPPWNGGLKESEEETLVPVKR